MTFVLDRSGSPLDHVAIGVNDTERGVQEIAKRIGYTPILNEPEPDQFYWSGAVPLGGERFLEILGPNPAFRKFNPFIEMVKRLDQPRPLFWYIATNDFAAFQSAARNAGAPMERVQTVTFEKDGILTDYSRGYLGPGFLSVSPNVIEWRSRSEHLSDEPEIKFLGLDLSHPDADRLNRVFVQLGINQKVKAGQHYMTLRLDTPNGPVQFAGEGFEFRGLKALITVSHLYGRWLLGC